MEQKTKADRNFGGHFISGFFKWAAVALVVGAVGGVVGTLFYSLVNGAADFRARYPFMLYFLPLFGLLIAHLYRINGMSDNGGTNQVISSVRDKNHPPVVIAPLIFVNNTLYKQSITQASYDEIDDNAKYLGEIKSDISREDGYEQGTGGVPAANFQANIPIVGAKIYQYGENIAVLFGGKYWVYEAYQDLTEDNGDKRSEREKQERDPDYRGGN